MVQLVITRLLQNPLGKVASAGERGDIVCVSDGRAKIYMDPSDFDSATRSELRAMLAAKRRRYGDLRGSGTDPERCTQCGCRMSPATDHTAHADGH